MDVGQDSLPVWILVAITVLDHNFIILNKYIDNFFL